MIDGKWLLGGAVLLGLGSLLSAGDPSEARPALREPIPPAAPADPLLSDTPVRTGKSYTVRGITYTPTNSPGYDQVGYASWYGDELSGSRTASGEAFDPAGISAAHRTLPLPSYVEVTALKTGRTIIVRVNDRGPFSNDRLIDLSRGAAEQLGISGHGAVAVRVRRVTPPDHEVLRLRAGARATERVETEEETLAALREHLNGQKGQGVDVRGLPDDGLSAGRDSPTNGKPPEASPAKAQGAELSAWSPVAEVPVLPKGRAYMVQLAAFASRDRADKAARRAGASLSGANGVWRVRTGPYQDAASALRGVELAAASGFNGARIMVND